MRRNKLSDFVDVNRNGKIAMKLDEGDGDRRRRDLHRGRRRAADHRGRASASASRCRTCASSQGRNSIGVRGITLAEGDKVISMAILRHFEATPDERAAYLKMRRAVRGEGEPEEPAAVDDEDEESARAAASSRRSAMPR